MVVYFQLMMEKLRDKDVALPTVAMIAVASKPQPADPQWILPSGNNILQPLFINNHTHKAATNHSMLTRN